jgi:hypothetical protein
MCVTSLARPYEKYVKGDVSIRDSFKKHVIQRGLGSHIPHGTTAGLSDYCSLSLKVGDLLSFSPVIETINRPIVTKLCPSSLCVTHLLRKREKSSVKTQIICWKVGAAVVL